MKRLLLLSSVALLTVNSCKNDGCNDPLAFNYDENGTSTESCIYEPKQISLTVSPNFGGESFNVKDTLDINDGRDIIINYYGYTYPIYRLKKVPRTIILHGGRMM